MRVSAAESRVVRSADGRRINRFAGCCGTKHGRLRGAGDGRPMGAGGAANAANGRRVITQAARGRAWCSRAQRVTARSARDVTGAPPRDVEGLGHARSRARLHSEQSMTSVCMPLYYFDSCVVDLAMRRTSSTLGEWQMENIYVNKQMHNVKYKPKA